MRFYIVTLYLILSTWQISLAQQQTDLVVVDARLKKGSLQIDVESLELLTNRNMYDNQPFFINEKQLAFSAADDKGNHDIIIYTFSSKKFINLTQTRDFNEFSPATTDCGLYVSSVTVEPTGKQRLWLYPNNFGEPELLYDNLEPVGYYAWYDNKAALFILGSPNKLIYPYSRDEIFTIAENVGRSIHLRPNSSIISYIDKSDLLDTPEGKTYAIKGFDIKNRIYHDFGRTSPDSEDMIWISKDILLMGSGSTLVSRNVSKNVWKPVADINLDTHGNISRLAYSAKLKKLILTMERQ
ncbi:hypothetical protein [Mongoliitalea lutea]|uniref:Uncharacterized protein n=1 Tax=Mongoliitalea lutea TaxID=849756 RepID=A0A8J3CV93_9BACT|nr:hypothetical protein [Mongoliitalea lutea]GHB24699.1 hypothetical protein GCM10008106_01790 [Mongoliitalea lutea]